MPKGDKTRPGLVLATRNKNKIAEIKYILGGLFDYRLIGDYLSDDVPESGRTLYDNSLNKALIAYELTNQPSLADDSGLFVNALNGEPGVFSARYGSTDQKRINRLLENLRGSTDRKAVFRAVFVYYHRPNVFRAFEGECPGVVAYECRGNNGFGYDPVFIPDGYEQTFAQMTSDLKNQISHRATALLKFKEFVSQKRSQVL